MNKPLKVVVMTTKLPVDIWLINKIADVCQIEGIVLPVKARFKEFTILPTLKKRLRQAGLIGVLNQASLLLYRLVFERRKDKKALAAIFTDKTYKYIENTDVDTLEVEDLNTKEVINFLSAKSADLVVINGTPLLKKPVIEAAKGNIINLHSGFAPQYRGRYGAYWPIYYREPELVGVTIHFLNGGVDTGAILLQQLVEYDPEDTLRIINYKQQRTGVNLLIKCLSQFDEIAPLAYHKEGCVSKNHRAMGLTHYLKARRWLAKRSHT
jgi:folate-dependent phosphoribosylglycinamide formyltransferase PurN